MKQQNAQPTKDNTKKKDYENFPRKIIRNDIPEKEIRTKNQNDFHKKDNIKEDKESTVLNNEKLYNVIMNVNKKKILLHSFKAWSNSNNDKIYEYDGKKAFKNMKKIQSDKNLEIKHNDDEFNVNDDLINNENEEKLDNKSTKENRGKNRNNSKTNKNSTCLDYNNIINKHMAVKSSRYKNNVFKTRNKEEEKRVSLSNITREIIVDKYNKKLINLLNIKRCQTDKVMIFFDKWFEKTYKNESRYKRSNKKKKIKKKKYIDKKIILDDSSNSNQNSNKEKSYENIRKYCKTGESIESRNNNKGRNYIIAQSSYDSFPIKNAKRNDKKSFGKSEEETTIRRNSHNFKAKNIFNKLNNNNEEDKSYKNNLKEGFSLLFKIISEHEKSYIYKIYINIFKKVVNENSKGNSSENGNNKYRRKRGKYSTKLKLKKIINMVSKSQNDNMIFTIFNKWRESKNINNNNNTNKNDKSDKNDKNDKNKDVPNINKKESHRDTNKENIANNENTTNKEKNPFNKIKPNEKQNTNYNYEDTNLLKEININKLTENKVEQKKKIYLHVVNNNFVNNNVIDLNKNKIKEERKNDFEKHNLGQISIKAQPPSQIINRGLPGIRKDNPVTKINKGNNCNKNKLPNEYPLLKKEYFEDKNNVEKELLKANKELSDDNNSDAGEVDSFEEELRKFEFKNLAINDFIGTMVKKGDINNNLCNNLNTKYKENNNNNFKQDKKPKVQPPKQVVEFNARKKFFHDNKNYEDYHINNDEDKNDMMYEREREREWEREREKKIMANRQPKGRQIKRYYYRENDKKEEAKTEKEKDKIVPVNENKTHRTKFPYKRLNHYNTKKKLTSLIKKIDSFKNKITCFTKWKNYINAHKEESNINEENKDNTLNLEIINTNEKELNSIQSLINDEKVFSLCSFHSEITENEPKENGCSSYDKIKEFTEYNKKLLNKNLAFYNKENNFDSYLSLLIKNCKAMTAHRMFCLYSLVKDKNKLCMIRNMLNNWRQMSKCVNNEKEKYKKNIDINSKLDNKNLLLKNVVVKYKCAIESNPKKYYFKLWIKK
jgi:hypothetical protein